MQNTIEVYDENKGKLQITKEQWGKDVLPELLKSHWNDSYALYQDILQALKIGCFSQVIDAVLQLKNISLNHERNYLVLATVYLLMEKRDLVEDVLLEYQELYGKANSLIHNIGKAPNEEVSVPGSYLPYLWLANYYLEEKNFTDAMELYDYLLRDYSMEEQVLSAISKALSRHGYVEEMLQLIVPLYDSKKHDPSIGLTLLQGYQELGNYLEEEK